MPARTGGPTVRKRVEIQPERGCHGGVIHLYRPLARKRDRDRRGSCKALAFFGRFR
jgi:hypothetical protein